MIRLYIRNVEHARDTASGLVEWLRELQESPSADHEVVKCSKEAIRHARALERWLTKRWRKRNRSSAKRRST